ncbi:MAG TPA: heat shock protein HspQ [Gammaproteobacteria bacterium]
MMQQKAAFSIGQIIRHVKYNYRGVIVDIDPIFSAPDEWYEAIAASRPPKDKPWYHVLVDDGNMQTYVAEQYLLPDESDEPINHPYVEMFFSGFDRDHYVSRQSIN